MTIYPMRFEVDGISVEVDRNGWRFTDPSGRPAYNALPVADRIRLRKEFELQVQLAQNTPTKGDR
jgi:hypothetical protein